MSGVPVGLCQPQGILANGFGWVPRRDVLYEKKGVAVVVLSNCTIVGIMRYHPEEDNKPYKMVYLEDPFGNLFELYSHSYQDTYSSEYE